MAQENNMQIVPKKFHKIVRVIYFMLRKGISKLKLLADLNIMMNRAQLAGKLSSIHNLMFHNHHKHHPAAATENHVSHPVSPNEYEFSCKTTPPPAYNKFNILNKKRNKQHKYNAPTTITSSELADDALFAAALEMAANSVVASPALPGFGRTPVVRQLRVTDSPFPLSNDQDYNSHVDEAAEEFIKRFHRDLIRQQQD